MPPSRRRTLPRLLHPVAWWVWGVGCATAASRTTNPLLLLLLIGVVSWVVVERRDPATPNPLPFFLFLGLFVIALRLVMTILLGNGIHGPTILFTLPAVPLPDWVSGVRIGGPVSLESLAYAVNVALQLAAILACLGAANALASPRRLLRYLPATLYDVGTAVVVALTFAPQLADDARRIRAARALRGHDGSGVREMGRLVVPVLEGALDRSLDLAASMESRGYGRVVRDSRTSRGLASALTVTGLVGVVAGLYGLMDASAGGLLGMPLLAGGSALAGAALFVGASRDRRSAYRRESLDWAEAGVTAVALIVAGVLVVGSLQGWAGLVPDQVPLSFPPLHPLATAAIVVAALPGVFTPPIPAVSGRHT